MRCKYRFPSTVWVGLEEDSDLPCRDYLKASLKLYYQTKIVLSKKIRLHLINIIDITSDEPLDQQTLTSFTLNIYYIKLPIECRYLSDKLTLEIFNLDKISRVRIGSHLKRVFNPCILDLNYLYDESRTLRTDIGLKTNLNKDYMESYTAWYKLILNGGNRQRHRFAKFGDPKLAIISVKLG